MLQTPLFLIEDSALRNLRLIDFGVFAFTGAGDGIRTRDFHLGKVAFYH